MRIAMISTPFVAVPPRGYGGTELVVHELVEGLVDRGHQVTLFATRDSRTSADLRYLFAEPKWPPGMMADLNHVSWAFGRIRAEGGYDVVHAHSAAALAFGRLLPELPLVYTLHHVRDETLSDFYRDFPQPYYVAISRNQAWLEEPLARLDVVHHGLEPSEYEWSARPADYVCFVGRFAEVKGPHTAIDAAARAGVRILMAGETHEVDADFGAREVQPRLAQPHVTYLGKIGPDRKRPLLRDARAVLAPITWEEPFGLILIESMLSGCPVVAFRRGSVPELVESGITGYVVDSAEEMVELIRPGSVLDDFDRERCRTRAVERFSRDRMVDGYEGVYRRAVAGTPVPRRRVAEVA